MQTRELEGKIAVVTGGSRGIGRAIAVALGRAGAKVIVNYASNETAAAEAVAAVVAAGGTANAKRFDVADAAAVDAAFKEIVAAEGALHILVNNAGIAVNGLVLGGKDADWKRSLDVNLSGTYHCCRAALRALMKAREAGRIINITSITGEGGSAGQAPYVAAKAGIIGLTKTLAKEFGRYDVTVNAVAFGYIQTRLTKPLSQGESGEIEVQGRKVKIGVQGGRIAAMNQMIPLGRGGLPEEAAGSVYLFCSPDSDYVSGQCLVVNGGL